MTRDCVHFILSFFHSKQSKFSTFLSKFTCFCICIFVLNGCGGGGGGGTSSPTTISGYIVKGPVTGAQVNLYNIAVDGTRSLVASTQTDNTGFYQFNQTPTSGGVFMVEAKDGRYINEVGNESASLTTPMRGVAVWNNSPMTVCVSAYSEMVVRSFEQNAIDTPPVNNAFSTAVKVTANSGQSIWTASNVNASNSGLSKTLGLDNLLSFKPLDLHTIPTSANINSSDFNMAILNGSVAGLIKQTDSSGNALSLSGALDSLYKIVLSDPYDDQANVALIKGTGQFIDTMGFTVDQKKTIKQSLYSPDGITVLYSLPDPDLSPQGVSTGSAISPMPNDGFQLVNQGNITLTPTGKTIFNKRGALTAFSTSSLPNYYKTIHSASVGEVYGDGDIGIGRWHGGVVGFAAMEANGNFKFNSAELLPKNGGRSYALGRPATQLPSCGKRILHLAKSTLGFSAITGLSADSTMSVQFSGSQYYVGYDIGFVLKDGTVTRITSPGGIANPWVNMANILPDFKIPVITVTGALSNQGLVDISMDGLLSGIGGKKMALQMEYRFQASSDNIAVAFTDEGTTLDTSNCGAISQPDNSAISPAPITGAYTFVAQPIDSSLSVKGNYVYFNQRGAVTKVQDYVASNPPETAIDRLLSPGDISYSNLLGNQDISIGLMRGTFNLFGIPVLQTIPYAVSKVGANLPSTGSRHYVLRSATPVFGIANSGSSTPVQITSGQVDTATLDVVFGENPIGTPNNFYGSVRVNIHVNIAGQSFNIVNPLDSNQHIVDGLFYGAGFDVSPIGSGYITDNSGHYATFCFNNFSQVYFSNRPPIAVHGCLLFEQQ
ncbi:hypothetical protein ACMYR3_05320 [Ampullimonas aquatilis]|uniref:hypothetical protein n=1 Tax=Ampullimonas aquatilis TaxID=1341549 RepID=UPI003C72217A